MLEVIVMLEDVSLCSEENDLMDQNLPVPYCSAVSVPSIFFGNLQHPWQINSLTIYFIHPPYCSCTVAVVHWLLYRSLAHLQTNCCWLEELESNTGIQLTAATLRRLHNWLRLTMTSVELAASITDCAGMSRVDCWEKMSRDVEYHVTFAVKCHCRWLLPNSSNLDLQRAPSSRVGYPIVQFNSAGHFNDFIRLPLLSKGFRAAKRPPRPHWANVHLNVLEEILTSALSAK